MAVKERSQIKGTDVQIKAFAGHNGVLAFATDTESLHVLSGTAGTTTEFLPSNKVATKTELDGKLSTSGGTVNGSIIFDGENYRRLGRGTGVRELEFAGSNNDGCFSFFPGESGTFSSKKSASLFLTSTGYTGNTIGVGAFALSAMDATTGAKTLAGYPDGSLTWGGTFSATTLKATSDKRKKTHITKASVDLSSLSAYRYKFKKPSDADKGFHVGLIAQEVEKILPEAVSKDEKGFLTLDYNAVVAVLVDEVNQLKSEIKQLQAKLS